MDEAHLRALLGGPAGWWQHSEEVRTESVWMDPLPVNVDVAGAEIRDHDFSAFSAEGYPGTDAGPNGVAALGLHSANFSGCDLRGCNFAGTTLMFTDFRNARLDGASFEGALLGNTRFEGASLVGTNFRDVRGEGILGDADVTNADFSGSDFEVERKPDARLELYDHVDAERLEFITQIVHGDWALGLSDEEYEQQLPEWTAKAETFTANQTDAWQLYAFVDMYNWDLGFGLLRMILDNPACDRGVALEIFWRSQPTYYQVLDEAQVESWQRESYEFVIELRDRLAAGRYSEIVTTFDATWAEPDTDGARWPIPDEWRELRR